MEIEASLAGRELVTLPQRLFSRIGIKSLDLSRNQIHEVPIELSHLLNLRTLNLSKNKLDDKSFPTVLENLVFLEELNLAGNNLTEIPSFVMNLPRLKVLKLAENKITYIPSALFKVSSLERLYLGDNQLSSIPPKISDLTNLRLLSLANNKITSVPQEMKEMVNLICLQLHNNRINFLPRGIVDLENLEDISLRGNPLINRFVREITYSPPSLLELAGRSVIHHQLDTRKLPGSLKQRLSHAKCCPNPNCDGVYFDNLYRQIKFADFCGRYRMPLLQFLCSPQCMTPETDDSSASTDDETYNPRTMRRVLLG